MCSSIPLGFVLVLTPHPNHSPVHPEPLAIRSVERGLVIPPESLHIVDALRGAGFQHTTEAEDLLARDFE